MDKNIPLDDLISLAKEALLAEGKSPRWYDEWHIDEILLGDFPKNNRVEFIEQEGGEGQGEDAHTILRVDDTFYLITYNYYSHMGFDLDYAKVKVVFPKKKFVTVYE